MRPTLRIALVAAVGVVASALAIWLFPRAFAIVALDNRLTQSTALAKADSFFAAHGLADSVARRAVRFGADREAIIFVDLSAGGADSVKALVAGKDVALYSWSVRAFAPGQVREASVEFAPDARVIGFRRKLADADSIPGVSPDSATALARTVLRVWLGLPLERWKVSATSYETKKPSERIDRTVTFERTDRMVGDAPIRIDVVIAGNTPSLARPYLHVPESFTRRYAEMRSSNELLALLATVGVVLLMGLGVWTIRRFSYHGLIRWRPALGAGAVIGGFLTAAGLNSVELGWYGYDTATPEGIFRAINLAGALAGGVMMGGMVALTLAAAEAASRIAFPQHTDWWKLWQARGTREVAAQVGGGYVVAAIALAYVTSFYLITRSLFGWWTPTEMMDDPNLIATAAPWINGIAISLQAGVWEEALFRALPLSLLSLWVGTRATRTWWMAGGIVATAIVFGFAHANYESWPAYSRGVEIFIDACFWGLLFVRFGMLVVVLAHFSYDLVLFSLFAATGTALEYRISAAIAVLVLLAPALVVSWRWIRQRGFTSQSDDQRFGGWIKPEREAALAADRAAPGVVALSARSRQVAFAAAAVAAALALTVPRRDTLGPAFTATRADAERVADSVMRARGEDPGTWQRLTTTASDTAPELTRFLRKHKLDSLAVPLAATYAVPAWWTVRYVHTTGTVADRAAEWRVRIYPDGRPFDLRRLVPDSAAGATLAPDSARRIARRAVAAAGIDTLALREADYDETPRPARRDVRVTWEDTTVHLAAGASARVWATLAGDEVLVVRRGIELPEAFHRAERERATRLLASTTLVAVLLVGALVAATVFVAKRRPLLVADRFVSARATWVAIGAFLALAGAGIANNWPNAVFGYDTATPWSTHTAMQMVSLAIGPAFAAALLLGLWNVNEMLRRRAGFMAWPDSLDHGAVRDSRVAGIGLGAVFSLSSLLAALVRSPSIPSQPTTSLDLATPVAGSLLDLGMAVVLPAIVTAIPPLVIMAITPRVRTRWLILAASVGLAAVPMMPAAGMLRDAGGSSALDAVRLLSAVAVVAAIVQWGGRHTITWFIAACTAAVVDALRETVTAQTDIERMGAAVGLVAAVGLLLWTARARRPEASSA